MLFTCEFLNKPGASVNSIGLSIAFLTQNVFQLENVLGGYKLWSSANNLNIRNIPLQ